MENNTLDDLILEAKLRAVLKTDSKLPHSVLKKIEETGLTGEELYNLKKTLLVHMESGMVEKRMLKFIDDYMRLVRSVHRYGKKLV